MGFVSRAFLAGVTIALVVGSLFRSRPPARQRLQAPRLREHHVQASDGARLPLASWLPDEAPVGLLLGVHGFGDYRDAFAIVGPQFARAGLAAFAYDQRGFGETLTRGHWPGADALRTDLVEVIQVLREAHPDLPLALIGESMGGSVALDAICSGEAEGVDRLILAAPGVRPNDVPLRQVHDLALRLAAVALPWLALELRRGGRPWLATEESTRLADDPRILRELKVGTYDGLTELVDRASQPPQVAPPPTLILYGELDGTIASTAIDQLAERLGESATVKRYPTRHHLLLHEHDTKPVVDDCLAWLTR